MGVKMCKNMYIYSWATVIVYIYTVTVACIFIILLISIRTNFSFSSPCSTTSAPHLLFFRCTQTHPHRQINTKTNSHTNKPTQTNQQRDRLVLGEFGSWIGQWRKDLGHGAWFVDRLVKKWSGTGSLVLGSIGEERILVARAWFVDQPVKKWSGSGSLVRGLVGEERIWVAGAWFVDWPVKKGSGSAGKERTQWRMKKKERPDSFCERERERGDL